MIFQSLISLYDRLHADGNVPPFGFSLEDIGFVITIDKEGNLIGQPEDLRTRVNTNTYEFFRSVVPYSNKVNVRARSAAKTPNFMADKADYIFGMSGSVEKKVHHDHFTKQVQDVCQDSKDKGAMAVKCFLKKWNPKDATQLEGWKEICGTHGKWVAFKLQGETGFVHERSEIKELWSAHIAKESYSMGTSFVDGKMHGIQPQYAQFKFGSGASLVSFNEKAYESYGKDRGGNAPISVEAEFKSATALKHLFRSKTQRLRIGDAATVFWTERASFVERFMGQVLNPSPESMDAIPVQKFLEAVRAGRMPSDIEKDIDLKFYILGLSVNKARLALRFWHVCTVSDLVARFRDHFGNLEIEPSSEKDFLFPGIWQLLKETARETKDISPVLGGTLTRSILTGTHYPRNLYHGVLGRIRADHRVSYLRASILKAILQRNHKKEVPMALNTERREVAYLLGRLFAVLEKVQLDALGKVKATIKVRFFSAASATPAGVFPRLICLSQHHIEKSEYGYIADRRIAKIIEHIDSFPVYLNLQDRGLFAIAYYQQKNAIDREIKEAAAKKKLQKIRGGK
ncbi:MAG: type I-C CRISPR-associated protein Cas8c/Csd1 [Deltaproteobacteria bacterium]|nr:MAG: type I-C CRISPR-associated protein Cas8c/Csd1 [Deltaproteobacteria bacterium]